MLNLDRIYYINLGDKVSQCTISYLKLWLYKLKCVNGKIDISEAMYCCGLRLAESLGFLNIGEFGENIIDFALYETSEDAVINNKNDAALGFDSSFKKLHTKRKDDLFFSKNLMESAIAEHRNFFWENIEPSFWGKLCGEQSYQTLMSYKWRNGKPTKTDELTKIRYFDVKNRYIESEPHYDQCFSWTAVDCEYYHKWIKAKESRMPILKLRD